MSSIGRDWDPFVSVVTLHGLALEKQTMQSAKPGNATMHRSGAYIARNFKRGFPLMTE